MTKINLKKRSNSKIAQLVAVAAAVPTLVLTTSTSASAFTPPGNTVSWQNDATGKCLNWADWWLNQNVKAQVGDCNRDSMHQSNWWEVKVDNEWWTFRPTRVDSKGQTDNLCLTSFNSLVYLETCSANNWWQQWKEVWTGSAWKLQHRGAGDYQGFFLDTNGRDLYTHQGNNGNYQIWH
ncbi:hypothetical protein [Streptomyces sp. NPDC089919]|uniref:hypothetical protein n=1 Tax=Streptomyces sp. NPDC089919 TaxID=3155188 RepID=UPI00342FCCA7